MQRMKGGAFKVQETECTKALKWGKARKCKKANAAGAQ